MHLKAQDSFPMRNILHGSPMLVDKTNFGLVLYNHQLLSVYLTNINFSLLFICYLATHLTVFNRTAIDIEKPVRAMHSCNSWLNHKSLFLTTNDFDQNAVVSSGWLNFHE